MNKRVKLALFATPIAALAAGSIIYAMPDKKPAPQLSTQPATTQSEVTSTDAQPVTPQAAQSTPTAVEPAPTPPPAPIYGEDPNAPGLFRVFDKTAVMDAAGIANGDREYVSAIAQTWTYKGPSDLFNICGVSPKSKMATAGADYETNPITQLKWCNAYVTTNHGTWATAYQRFLAHRF